MSLAPARFVVLDAGWSGEAVLIRLLSAGGAVHVCGHPLERPVVRPVRHLVRALKPRDRRASGVLVRPEHLWLHNRLDSSALVGQLVADGVVVLSLHRSVHVDRGLSRALCGPRSEVLPAGVQLVDPGHIAVFAKEAELAAAWFAEVVPRPDLRLVYEDDLATPAARQATVERVADALGLSAWDAPAEPEPPSHDVLWGRVADPARCDKGSTFLARC